MTLKTKPPPLFSKHLRILLCATLLLNHSTVFAKPAPATSGVLSIVPGLGQTANGDALEGLGWFVTSVGLYFSGSAVGSSIGFKIWEYNMYDAYRDAGPIQRNQIQKNQYNVFQNYIAFLNPMNLIDPFSVGIVGLGTYESMHSKPRAATGSRAPVTGAFVFGFVALGEEGLFRGFLFPAFSSAFSSKLMGATVSSALFSLSHLTNKQSWYHSPGGLSILFLGGMLLCWQTDYQQYDLRHSIFAHAWYDFILDYGHRGDASAPEKIPATGIRINFPI